MGVLFFLLRGIERWLHQHIFKVGWLLTHNYETTTILYYTVFLPGVLLHEVVYWLMAGIMNVRADRSIQWPKVQEIGDLQLNFIKIAPKAHPLKRAVIAATPLFVGLLAIWLIAVNAFQLEAVITTAGTGRLEDIAKAIGVLTSAPDFWLWFYISFTIANTMFPNIPKDMKGWWQIAGAIGVVISVLVVLGIGQTLLADITLTLTQLLNSLSLTLILTMFINLLMVMGLGFIEYAVERATGHSATFQRGKMITMTRQEALALKAEEQQKRLAARTNPQRRLPVVELTSVYALEFPIPGSPSQEPITKGVAAILGMEDEAPTTAPEEDEIVETTATDSERQRRLRLFPETPRTTDEESQDTGQQLLPESTSPVDEKPQPPPVARPKPAFNVQAFDATPTTEETQIDGESAEDLPVKEPVISEPEPIIENAVASNTTEETIAEPPQAIAETTPELETTEIEQKEDIAQTVKDIEEKPEVIESPVDDEDSSDIDIDDEIDDEDDLKSVASATSDSQSQLTSVPTIEEESDEEEDDQLVGSEDNADSVAAFPRPFARPFQPFDDDEPEEEDEDKEFEGKPQTIMSSAEFPRPFAPRETFEDEEDEDEQLPIASSRIASSWRQQLSSIGDDEDDEDEQLSESSEKSSANPSTNLLDKLVDQDEDDEDDKQLPHTSVFDSLTKPSDEKSPTATPDWRSKFANLDSNDDDDDEDEQLGSRSPSRTNIFDSLTKPSTEDTKSTASNWRSKLTDLDSDDDDDDEQLGSRSTPSTSLFDSLTKPSTEDTKSTASNWRSKFNNLDSDDDDDDEQLGSKPTSRTSMFDSLTKPSDEKSTQTTPNWRSKLTDLDSDDDNDEDEQLGSKPISRTNIFDSLTKPSDAKSNSPSSNWRSQLSDLDSDDDDDEELGSRSILSGLGRPKSDKPRSNIVGSGSRPVPKPTGKSTDWRNKLNPLEDTDDEDEDDESITYEPFEDEIIYEDDPDEVYYDDDEDDVYYDE